MREKDDNDVREEIFRTMTTCERRENVDNYKRGERKKAMTQERRKNDNDSKRERKKKDNDDNAR